MRGRDAVVPLRLTLTQAALGTVVRPRIPFDTVCSTCGGAPGAACTTCGSRGVVRGQRDIEVQVPGGVESGARLRLRGQGEPGRHGGARGDLYLVCHVREHAMLVRRGSALFCEVVISAERARAGTTVDVPALDGGARLEVPARTPHGAILKVPGRGGRALDGPGRGALYVRIIVAGMQRPARGPALLARFPAEPSAPPHPVILQPVDAPSGVVQVEPPSAARTWSVARMASWAVGGGVLLGLAGAALAALLRVH